MNTYKYLPWWTHLRILTRFTSDSPRISSFMMVVMMMPRFNNHSWRNMTKSPWIRSGWTVNLKKIMKFHKKSSNKYINTWNCLRKEMNCVWFFVVSVEFLRFDWCIQKRSSVDPCDDRQLPIMHCLLWHPKTNVLICSKAILWQTSLVF